MWDWQRSVVLPLVVQGLARSVGRGPPAGEEELVLADGRPVRYQGRVDLLLDLEPPTAAPGPFRPADSPVGP